MTEDGYDFRNLTPEQEDARARLTACDVARIQQDDLTARHERMAEAMWEQHRSTAGYTMAEAEPWGDLPASWHAHWIAMARAADTARDAT